MALVLLALSPRVAHAQVSTWNVTTGTWATGGSWLSGAPATTGTAYFSNSTLSGSAVTAFLSAGTTIGGLVFDTGTTTLRSNSTTAQTLTLGTGGITVNATSGPVAIGVSGSMVNLVLGGTQTWTNDSTGLLTVSGTINTASSGGVDSALTIAGSGSTTLSGVISGSAGRVISLVKNGTGLLTVSGNNTFTGGSQLNAGTVNIGHVSALGTGTVRFTGNSTLQAGVAGTVANTFSIDSGVVGTFDNQSNAVTLSGVISGLGGLTKSAGSSPAPAA